MDKRKGLLRFIALMAATAAIVIANLMFFAPTGQKLTKTGNQIYKEADYLALVSIQHEDPRTGELFTSHASGSLINFNNQYLILTAAHIERQGYRMKEIAIRLKGQPGVYFAAIDKKNNDLDCAILKISNPDFLFIGRLPRFRLEKDYEVGDRIYSLGSPFSADYALGEGIIRNLNYTTRHGRKWENAIVTSADTGLAPGNSGGPLLDARGEIIALNVGILVDGDARTQTYYPTFGFAIPITEIMTWLAAHY